MCTAAGIIDMRRGFDGLAALAQTPFETDPFSGQIVAFNRVWGPSAETGSGRYGGMATGSRRKRASTGDL
ncbi:IS66 family insertion sequence element accessory protein TnpB [Thauera phenylacetica]